MDDHKDICYGLSVLLILARAQASQVETIIVLLQLHLGSILGLLLFILINSIK